MNFKFNDKNCDIAKNAFSNINISWILTTNYDTAIEYILTGKCLSLGPNDSFVKIKNLIPIYHIHGIKTDPQNIVITNEDYIYQFRPNDYRQSRLPFLIKESTVLMLGYGLGDMNVITAVDWSKNVYKNESRLCPNKIIQVVYIDGEPKNYAYEDSSGIIIVETNNLSLFLKDMSEFCKNEMSEEIGYQNDVKDIVSEFSSEHSEIHESFITDSSSRRQILEFIRDLPPEYYYVYISFMDFIRKVTKKLESESSKNCNFEAYNTRLGIVLDIIEMFDFKSTPPEFLEFIIYCFHSLSCYIGNSKGQSYSAYETWEKRKINIATEKIEYVYNYSSIMHYSALQDLIEKLL